MTRFLEYWPVLLVILNAIATWAAWSLRQLAKNEVRAIVSAAAADLAATDDHTAGRVDDLGDRLLTLEEAVRHLPTGEDVDRLTAAVATVDKSVAAQSATLAAVKEAGLATQAGVDRLYRFFLERGV